MSKELLLRLIGPLITALGIWGQELRHTRDDYGRRKLARAEATEMVAFIEQWVKTQQLTCPPEEFEAVKRSAHQQLERVYSLLMKNHETKPPAKRPLLKRVFLLYKPPSFGGWIAHIAFYLLVFFLGMFSIGVLIPNESKEEPLTWTGIIGGFALYLVLILIVRALAVYSETKRQRPKENESVSSGPTSHH